MLVNTSFNVRGEPIVCTPEDAFRRFMGTEMETLLIGNCLLRKPERPLPGSTIRMHSLSIERARLNRDRPLTFE